MVIVDALKTVAGAPLVGVVCHLYKHDYDPTPQSKLTDFIECDFDGYAKSTNITWGATFVNALLQAVTTSVAALEFKATGSTKPQVVHGYYIADEPPTKVVFAESFNTPVPINDATAAVVLVPTFAFGG